MYLLNIIKSFPINIVATMMALMCLFIMKDSLAEESSDISARSYRSPEERREAGLGTKINDWITFSGLLEIEKYYLEDNLKNNRKFREYGNTSTTVQSGLEIKLLNWLGAELVYEAEHDGKKLGSKWDEAFVYLEFDKVDVGLEIGRISTSFGEYYSHFSTGPLLEFGETIRNGLIVDYSIFDAFEFNLFAIESKVDKRNKSRKLDWGGGLEYTSRYETARIGVTYISDLSESDERFLREESNEYKDKVAAWNAYALIGFDNFEITAELVRANNRFKEFERTEDKPIAYNFELAYFPSPDYQLAFRYEGSDEYSEEPVEQYGVSLTWRPINRMSLTGEYLHGRYENNFVLDDNDVEFDDKDYFAIQASIEF